MNWLPENGGLKELLSKWRSTVLKYLHSRPILILICTLVVVECICVMAELMVDLEGIKFRFENEEKEINKFLEFLEKKYPDDFAYHHGKTLEEILYMLRERVVLVTPDIKSRKNIDCICDNPSTSTLPNTNDQPSETNPELLSDFDTDFTNLKMTTKTFISESNPTSQWINNSAKDTNDDTLTPKSTLSSHSTETLQDTDYDDFGRDEIRESVFIFEVNNDKDIFFLAARYKGVENVSEIDDPEAHLYEEYHDEYERIHSISHGIHFASLLILSVMVLEVFDAFIVIASFALDFIFLDSRWYETGKDATTILVLLLPWRVVRIVNSFLMTLNHKHHIEIVTIKRARKRCEIKISKLRGLLSEIRKDVELLIELARSKGAVEHEVTSCIYGKGRGVATLTAFASFASLMFISTLGKDPCDNDSDDALYENVIHDALRDKDEDNDEDESETENNNNDNAMDYDLESVSVGESSEENAYVTDPLNWKRRHTIPRRQNSADDIHSSIFYVNSGYISQSESCRINRNRKASLYSKSSVRSMPVIPIPRVGKNYVSFEFTTQVTYL